MFCPKCGSLMIPNKGKYICNNCGYETLKKGQNETKEDNSFPCSVKDSKISGEAQDAMTITVDPGKRGKKKPPDKGGDKGSEDQGS